MYLVFENRVLKEIFGHKREWVTGERSWSFMIGECKKHPLTNQCKHGGGGGGGGRGLPRNRCTTFLTLH